MPLLSYAAITDYPFQPFTKIYSADINNMFATISTLLNVTLLDRQNVQAHGLTRYTSASNLAAGTPNFVVYNDSNGDLTEGAALPVALGGLGVNLGLTGPTQAGQGIVVNPTGTGFQLSSSTTSTLPLFNYYTIV